MSDTPYVNAYFNEIDDCMLHINMDDTTQNFIAQSAAKLGYPIEQFLLSVLYQSLETSLREDRFQFYLQTGKPDTSQALQHVLAHLALYPIDINTTYNR